jgi:hypothetical protein
LAIDKLAHNHTAPSREYQSRLTVGSMQSAKIVNICDKWEDIAKFRPEYVIQRPFETCLHGQFLISPVYKGAMVVRMFRDKSPREKP